MNGYYDFLSWEVRGVQDWYGDCFLRHVQSRSSSNNISSFRYMQCISGSIGSAFSCVGTLYRLPGLNHSQEGNEDEYLYGTFGYVGFGGPTHVNSNPLIRFLDAYCICGGIEMVMDDDEESIASTTAGESLSGLGPSCFLENPHHHVWAQVIDSFLENIGTLPKGR